MTKERFGRTPRPPDEAARLAALRSLRILDTGPEERFDRITRLAQQVFGVPIALVSLVDEDRQWFKSCRGLSVTETPRDVSFCTYAILGDEPLVVPDARQDARFADSPLVTGDPGVRFYAGMPVGDRFGNKLGTLCVMDRQPRQFSTDQVEMLKDLAVWVEEELESGREHYADLFAASPVALWEQDFTRVEEWLKELRAGGVVDLRGYLAAQPGEVDTAVGLIRVVDVNEAAVALLDADSKDQLLAGLPPEMLTQEVRGSFVEQLVAIWDQRPSVEIESTGVTLRGDRLDYLLRWSAPPMEGGSDLSRVLVAITDLTERTRAAEAMRQSEERFRVLFDTAADAIIGVDHEQRIMLFNEEATSLFGYEAEEVIGEPLTMLMPPEFRDAHPGNMASFAQGNVSRRPMGTRGVMRGIRKNGEEFPIEVTIAKRPTDGHFEFTAVARDITARVQAQQALEDLVKSKNELIASISHELRTPLTAVVGFARILQDEVVSGVSGEERAEMIRLIAEEGIDLTNIVEDLLTAAKAQAGTLAVVHVPVDLRAQTAQILETWSQQEAGHIEVTGASIQAIADPARVRQILRNLISNALRYGGDKIRISISSDDTTARIQVSDNGPGIPEEEQQRIFESYQHGPQDPGLTPSMGLGLTISRHLAQLMNGDLTYRHQTGETIFELAFPVAT